MAIAIVAPAEIEVGQVIKITGTGFTASGNVEVSAESEESNGGLSVQTAVFAAGGGGTFDTTGVLDLVPLEEGHVNVTVTDVTAATSKTARIEVFRSSE